MRTTKAWALRRQIEYGSLYIAVLLLIFVGIYFRYFHNAPTCFDGWENGDEIGVDCGGSCSRICAVQAFEPRVNWAKSFKVSGSIYNAVAYVENTNKTASTEALKYNFLLYDDEGLITMAGGTTILPPDNVYPVFTAGIDTGGRVPKKTFLELEPVELWQSADGGGREEFSVINRSLNNAGTKPRLDATIKNNSLVKVDEVEVVATIFNIEGVPLTSSRTIVSDFAPGTERSIVFTWREPIAATVRSCEIPTDVLVAIDLSGSMNDDGEEPPEPLTSVLTAAERFVNRLATSDQIGIITFATDALLRTQLQQPSAAVGETVSSLTIDPNEETGSTNTGDVFVRAREEFAETRSNPDARNVLVVLTDGLATEPEEEPEQYALDQANLLKSLGVTVYTIGLGEKVNMEFLKNLASEPNFAYQALDSSQVDKIYQTITSSLCETGPTRIDIIPKTDAFFVPLDR